MQGAARLRRMALAASAAASLAGCASLPSEPPGQASTAAGGARVGPPYQVNGVWYTPRQQPDYDQVGTASWYGEAFDGRLTADGEIFDMTAVSAAHTTLPLPCIVEVTNLDNGRRLKVRVNDRGPFAGDRIIDLSREAARQLGYDRQGLARVRVRYVGPAPLLGPEAGVRIARARPPVGSAEYASAAPAKPRAPAKAPGDDEVVFTGAPVPPRARPLQILPAMPATASTGMAASPRAGGVYRIQAGAFGDEHRAQRAAVRLGGLGLATVEPLQRDGVTLYRVVVTASSDAIEAYDLRERVAEAGFADARVIGPS
jgi:rare lipoprotein A